jgi:putative DNA primase/helicase
MSNSFEKTYGDLRDSTPWYQKNIDRAAKEKAARLKTLSVADIEMTGIEWLWPNRFAIGKLGIIAGLPDEGKGQITCDMIAWITTIDGDKNWPCNEGKAPHANVILASAEDDFSDTIKPRLASAGADMSRIRFVDCVYERDKDRMFSLITDLQLLHKEIIEFGNVGLVVIDPISAYLGHGRVDSYRTTDIRGVLAPVVKMAAQTKTSIVGIMHFNKKVDVTNALLRISDSLAFGATARHVFGVIADDENDRKLFCRAKNNLAAKNVNQTLAYRFGAHMVGHDPNTKKEIWAPHVLWEPNYVDLTAVEAMQAAAENKSPSEIDRTKDLLAEMLAQGAVQQQTIEDRAHAELITIATLRRAKRKLDIKSAKDHTTRDAPWYWKLPDSTHCWPWEKPRCSEREK